MRVCEESIAKVSPNCAFMIFTANVDGYEYGDIFAQYLRKNHLGKVHGNQIGYNPNSQHNIRVWMWQVNWDELKSWYNKNK